MFDGVGLLNINTNVWIRLCMRFRQRAASPNPTMIAIAYAVEHNVWCDDNGKQNGSKTQVTTSQEFSMTVRMSWENEQLTRRGQGPSQTHRLDKVLLHSSVAERARLHYMCNVCCETAKQSLRCVGRTDYEAASFPLQARIRFLYISIRLPPYCE